ncbi:hypothetical protein GCM10010272_02820 [Streptomyces lateritius]|nr:hypothetical protein GCM10010272_02820 [Streptomyces lateritius]
MELVRDELVREPAGEGHEVVGGDGAGDCDTHGWVLLRVRKGVDSSRYRVGGVLPTSGNYPRVGLFPGAVPCVRCAYVHVPRSS